MKKKLFLIRHAKSSWANSQLNDYSRPLNERGYQAIETMRKYLLDKHFTPDKILFSTALRTTQTMEGICSPFSPNIIREGKLDLYAANCKKIIQAISQTPEEIQHLFYIGHNPGITDALNYLCDESIGNVPTLGIAEIEFTNMGWDEIFKGTGSLKSFEYPKNLQ